MSSTSRRVFAIVAGGVAVVCATALVAPAAVARSDCGTFDGQGCASSDARVDLSAPSFSNPTSITNPLFPISELHATLLLGHVDGKPFRTETTLLPGTETVRWRGQDVEVLVSQYMAYLDGRLAEVALDRYAQADDGSVWYFGEDVFDYAHGTVAATEGTWLAGRDGPPAMIMPVDPKVGDVYRPENAPNIVFEEVTVGEVGKTVEGPLGSVEGALVVDELHQDGSHEPKVFAPGYGEFSTGDSSGDLEAIALAVPTDSLPGLPPAELATMSSGAVAIVDSVRLGNWQLGAATVERVASAWDVVRAGERPPKPIAALVKTSMRRLRSAFAARDERAATQAAIDLGQSSLDLELRHRPPVEIDTVRFELWTHQLRVDAAARDTAAVANDVAALEWIRDRFVSVLDAAGRAEIEERLSDLHVATDTGNLLAAIDHAARLGARIRHLTERNAVG